MSKLVSAFVEAPSVHAAMEVVCRRAGLKPGARLSSSVHQAASMRGNFTNRDQTGFSYPASVVVEFALPKGVWEQILPGTEICDEPEDSEDGFTWDATLTASTIEQLIERADQIKMFVVPRQ